MFKCDELLHSQAAAAAAADSWLSDVIAADHTIKKPIAIRTVGESNDQQQGWWQCRHKSCAVTAWQQAPGVTGGQTAQPLPSSSEVPLQQ